MKNTQIALLTISSLFIGCASTGNFTHSGIPKEKYYIGGGFSYSVTPEESGMLYVVEKNSGKLLKTHHIDANKGFSDHTLTSPELLKSQYGVEHTEAKITLYFIPDNESNKS